MKRPKKAKAVARVKNVVPKRDIVGVAFDGYGYVIILECGHILDARDESVVPTLPASLECRQCFEDRSKELRKLHIPFGYRPIVLTTPVRP